MRDEKRRLLYRYPDLNAELGDLAEKIKDLEAQRQAHYGRLGTTLDADRAGSAGPGDPTAAAAEHVMKVKARLSRLYAASGWRLDAVAMVDAFLEKLDALERPVIELRYFQKRAWEDVAAIQAISLSTAYRLHSSALRKWPDKVDSF